jgi:hypothetical protein
MFYPIERGVPCSIETAVLLRQIGRSQQFHRHGSHLGEFHSDFQLLDIRQMIGLEDMKGVTGLVEHGAHIVAHTDGIHEDERALGNGKLGAIAAGRFPLAAVQIQQSLAPQRGVVLAQLRIDVLEYPLGLGD